MSSIPPNSESSSSTPIELSFMDDANDAEVSTPRNLGGGIRRELSSSPSGEEDNLPQPVRIRRPYSVDRKTFSELLEHCRLHRVRGCQISGRTTFTNFTLSCRPGGYIRLYSLGRTSIDCNENSLLCTDISNAAIEQDDRVQTLFWKSLIEVTKDEGAEKASPSKEEELLRQRLRQLIGGIGSYEFNAARSSFLYCINSKLYVLTDDASLEQPVVKELHLKDIKCEGSSPMDVKSCPTNISLKAFVLNSDIYLLANETVHRLTNTGDEKLKVKTAGVASYIIQEEFDRLSGYWWCPKSHGNKYYILYEENDATGVDIIAINCPAELLDNAELMRYPKPGRKNVAWNAKIVQFTPLLSADGRVTIEKTYLHCVFDLRRLFPWAEYLIRVGWMPDGSGIWLQLLSRLQKKLVIVYVPLKLFVKDDITNIDMNLSEIIIVYQEDTVDFIIKEHNYLTFLKTCKPSKGSFNFIWSHGNTGFSHLYLITSTLECFKEDLLSLCNWSEIAITRGDYEVSRKAEPYVDESRGLLYFLANRDNFIESHLYCVDYLHPALSPNCLTQPGYSYGFHRDNKAFFILDNGDKPWSVLAIPRSNLATPNQTTIYRLSFPSLEESVNGVPSATLAYIVSSMERFVPLINVSPKSKDDKPQAEYPPEVFMWRSQNRLHYGCLLRPCGYDSDHVFPVVLYVYGGPEVQLVRNAYSGNLNLNYLTSLGFAVVYVDGRGSAHRGMLFEHDIWGNMGTVELDDQMEGLRFISSHSGCLDLSRLAIMGWSYGGYMALMGLGKHRPFFKAAVVGAPVTSWEYYDTGYAERYMGMPDANADAYKRSSILNYVRYFPDESGRLLLLHGLMDENVHFQHTSALINALTKAGKPYRLQIYPSERHAVSNFETCVHMEATILDFLISVLGPVILMK